MTADVMSMTDKRNCIGPKVLKAIHDQVSELFETYERKIEKSMKDNGNEIAVSFKVGLKIVGDQVAVQTGIDFTAEKIKYKSEIFLVSEIQGKLFTE